MRLLITAGQASDKTAFLELLAGLPSAAVVVAAKGGTAYIPTQRRVRVIRRSRPLSEAESD